MTKTAMRIVIPGGSGQIGTMLARHFDAGGHKVTVLSRNPRPAAWQELAWDSRTAGPWVAALEGSDVCINLAGRSVNCRYSSEHRAEIHDSRTLSTRLLNEVIGGLAQPPRVWLNASTATIYRHALDRAMDEATGEMGGDAPDAPDTWNFSVNVAKDWEEAFFSMPTPRTRKVAMRSAITFNVGKGSAFEVLSRLVRFGLGGANGDGRQFVSWIHEADFVRAVDLLIGEESLAGAVNLTAPHPLPNREFMRGLREAWGMPIGIPARAWMIEIGSFFLRTESELVLKSRRVVPGRLLDAGFQFEYPEWPAAARELVSRWRVKY